MKLKGDRAITLVALVITIIVLLILAGITIATLTGENGMLNKAADSKIKTEDAQKYENKALDEYVDKIDKELGTEKTYKICFNYKNGINQQKIIEVELGKTINFPEHEYDLEKCTFSGWSTEENGNVVYTDKQQVLDLAKSGEILNLYAKYLHSHDESCLDFAYKKMEFYGISNIRGYYPVYLDENCTKLAPDAVQTLISSAQSGTTLYKGKTKIIYDGNTYYTDLSKVSVSSQIVSGNSAIFKCSSCKKGMHSTVGWNSIEIYHLCSSPICGYKEGIQ